MLWLGDTRHLFDWVTQRWVELTGRRFNPAEHMDWTLNPARGRSRPIGRVAPLLLLALHGCGSEPLPEAPPLAFDTARAVVRTEGGASPPILVELALSAAQRSHGLSRRTTLDSMSGMFFRFDSTRTGDEGFWMWRTLIPLDIAFLDSAGVIQRILTMEPTCPDALYAEACPSFIPGVPYASVLEMNGNWFASHAIETGARVELVADSAPDR